MHPIQKYWKVTETWLLSEPPRDANLPLRTGRRALRIGYAVLRDIAGGQLTLHAMSLVYTTMLSVVPLLALSLSILKAFDVQDQFTPMLWTFFEPMGAKGQELYNSVLGFIDNIQFGLLGAVGFVLLFYTVVSLIQKIETAFNMIWHAPQMRSFSRRFSNYLSVILVGPVLVVAALSFTATTMSSSLMQALIAIEPFGTLMLWLSKFMPFFMIIGAFTFFYVLMPNTRVRFVSALIGGSVAGCLWQVTSLLFAAFVVGSAQYDAIYSSFAVGIVLLIWLYANWLILLAGSSIAFYHQHGGYITRVSDPELTPELLEAAGLDIMRRVARHHHIGQSPLRQNELETRLRMPAILTRKIVDKLVAHGLLLWVGDKADQLALGGSSDEIRLSHILHALRADDSHLLKNLHLPESVTSSLKQAQSASEKILGERSLRDLNDTSRQS